ncbi:hypothetical protein BDV97DRAFT_373680 [Delphinella strobiligena]|nr:hypothetical protein BDV97DRAFT_373680 [Delphinella strobiligena]
MYSENNMVSNEVVALIKKHFAATKKAKDCQVVQGTPHGTIPQIKVQQASPTMAPAMLPTLSNGQNSCPQGTVLCHWHPATGKKCHIPWRSCPIAMKAIKAAFHAHSAWPGAPRLWNKWHAQCIQEGAKLSDMCQLHLEIYQASPSSHDR